jgi:hypothetical protein
MVPRRNRYSIQPNKQESTEGHHGNSLSRGTNYFHDYNVYVYFLTFPEKLSSIAPIITRFSSCLVVELGVIMDTMFPFTLPEFLTCFRF